MSQSQPIRREAQAGELANLKSANKAAAQASNRLSKSPYRELRKVTCLTTNGELVLEGWVTSFYLKQVAQEIVRHVDGVSSIANCLRVRPLH